ncbi:MAG: ribonuclease HII [Patescibacteria group bacterium]|nr:ribonuclease HII [Patescibacteria group bacterium]
MNKKPSFDRENELLKGKIELVFGMDEVGRGSFAGPLVASAVCFTKEFKWFSKINDSKLLTPRKRQYLSTLILKHGICLIELIDVEVINQFGIGETNKLIFENLTQRISKEYKKKKIFFLIDGRKKKVNSKNIEFIVKGDQKSVSIAASSIIAKVYRDELMRKMGKEYKGYNFSNNKGYGTKFHIEALKKLGLSEIHRRSFRLQKFLR